MSPVNSKRAPSEVVVDSSSSSSSNNSNNNNNNATATVYRCGSTDALGEKLQQQQHEYQECSDYARDWHWSHAEQLVSKTAGLILDLRSPPERNEDAARNWMEKVSTSSASTSTPRSRSSSITDSVCRPIRVLTTTTTTTTKDLSLLFRDAETVRYVIRLDLLNRTELLRYALERWIIPPETATTTTTTTTTLALSSRIDINPQLHNAIMTELNARGLAGLNEAILETPSGQNGLCLALQAMTLYREERKVATTAKTPVTLPTTTTASVAGQEQHNKEEHTNHKQQKQQHHNERRDDNYAIVFHCVQGKDRTGMLAMLMQLLLGKDRVSDEDIVEDYYRSNDAFREPDDDDSANSSSAAAAIVSRERTSSKHNNRSHNRSHSRTAHRRVRMDKAVFSGTNRPAMISTLEGLRQRYGRQNNNSSSSSSRMKRNNNSYDHDKSSPSASATMDEGHQHDNDDDDDDRTTTSIPGYFDRIGFDRVWRNRFREAFSVSHGHGQNRFEDKSRARNQTEPGKTKVIGRDGNVDVDVDVDVDDDNDDDRVQRFVGRMQHTRSRL